MDKDEIQFDKSICKLEFILCYTSVKQYELANILGCPAGTMNRWMRYKSRPSHAWKELIDENKDVIRLYRQAKINKEKKL